LNHDTDDLNRQIYKRNEENAKLRDPLSKNAISVEISATLPTRSIREKIMENMGIEFSNSLPSMMSPEKTQANLEYVNSI
jgi:hypothetical protein